jgi:hypothetical protein
MSLKSKPIPLTLLCLALVLLSVAPTSESAPAWSSPFAEKSAATSLSPSVLKSPRQQSDFPLPTITEARLPAPEMLSIPPVFQETPVWCWLAVGEMVHRYYGLPTLNPAGDFQCGLVATLAGPNSPCWTNCGNCIGSAGNYGPVNQVVADMVRRYPEVLRNMNRYDGPTLTVQWRYSALSDNEITNEIDAERPVIAGISPSGYPQNVQSEHVALVIGYEATDEGMNVIVNDPFPFNRPPFNQRTNPYTAQGGQSLGNGRYSIAAARFRQGLVWRETFYNIGKGDTPAQVSNVLRCVFQQEPAITYFVRSDNQIVGVLPNGQQRVVGRRIPPTVPGFAWMYATPVIAYGVDAQGAIWNRAPNGMTFQIGYCGS